MQLFELEDLASDRVLVFGIASSSIEVRLDPLFFGVVLCLRRQQSLV